MLTRQWAVKCYAERLRALPPEMARAVEAYADHLIVQRYSDWYVFGSRYYTILFCEWAGEREITRPQDVTLQVLESYQRYIYHQRTWRGKRIGVQSQRHHMAIVSCWFKWLHRRELISHDPSARLQLPRRPKRIPRAIFTREEIESLMALPDLGRPTGLRDRTMMEVMYATAVRRSELIGLTLDDLDLPRKTARILDGKGLKDRVVPLGGRAAGWLVAYLEKARPELEKDRSERALFLAMTGRPLLPSAVSDIVKRLMRKAGIEKRGACHLFRHSAATEMLRNGADVRVIQSLLGHADLNATQVYAQVTINDLRQVHEQTHPSALSHTRRDQAAQERAAQTAEAKAAEAEAAEVEAAEERAAEETGTEPRAAAKEPGADHEST